MPIFTFRSSPVCLTDLGTEGEQIDARKRRKRGDIGKASENVRSGVGYGKIDYPTQQAIYHCQGTRGKETVWGERRGKSRNERERLWGVGIRDSDAVMVEWYA